MWREGGDRRGIVPLLKSLNRKELVGLRFHESITGAAVARCAEEFDIAVLLSVSRPYSDWLKACQRADSVVIVPDTVGAPLAPRSFTYTTSRSGVPDLGELRSLLEAAQKVLMAGDLNKVTACQHGSQYHQPTRRTVTI